VGEGRVGGWDCLAAVGWWQSAGGTTGAPPIMLLLCMLSLVVHVVGHTHQAGQHSMVSISW
jgi:hypothetical protein